MSSSSARALPFQTALLKQLSGKPLAELCKSVERSTCVLAALSNRISELLHPPWDAVIPKLLSLQPPSAPTPSELAHLPAINSNPPNSSVNLSKSDLAALQNHKLNLAFDWPATFATFFVNLCLQDGARLGQWIEFLVSEWSLDGVEASSKTIAVNSNIVQTHKHPALLQLMRALPSARSLFKSICKVQFPHASHPPTRHISYIRNLFEMHSVLGLASILEMSLAHVSMVLSFDSEKAESLAEFLAQFVLELMEGAKADPESAAALQSSLLHSLKSLVESSAFAVPPACLMLPFYEAALYKLQDDTQSLFAERLLGLLLQSLQYAFGLGDASRLACAACMFAAFFTPELQQRVSPVDAVIDCLERLGIDSRVIRFIQRQEDTFAAATGEQADSSPEIPRLAEIRHARLNRPMTPPMS